ncbi:aminotransferase class I/II-fold pyridoxal phosphate-dependent enzyme [Hydrogenibacillus schlegelii]|uniref:Arginine decarboxylase n=1 Tax=Hydrogenibacillus schlegelii TaxID=1484 RepID=A0A132N8W4_HYDSH|nr:aminotransferase class I/II-fold pyridoxal phosphate-dependent enzyme [Hydrogenibacillus schlegelii]KWX06543.1 arginine decarboxylase [Hydrogenibacillus schlegelii]OAR04630.1 arginine decarboxylase [Hydrogenibacillus schlegelii]
MGTEDRQRLAPLFDGLVAHVERGRYPFHIPGHKGGRGADPAFRAWIGERAFWLDLINIAPLDDLHAPRGIIRDAERLAAEAFGAEHAFFSVQGTSTAIMAMVLAAVGPGEKIIVPRNVHKSVLSAIILAGAVPIFIYPEMDQAFGIAHGISPDAVERALEAHPDARAVFVVHPTYYGVALDLPAIVATCHRRGVPVLVDEAHGAHFSFHPKLPPSAMESGADAAATSVHKLGGSLTQSSLLLHQGRRIAPERLRVTLSLLMTTSTSYLLLASLDTARRQLAVAGEARLQAAIERAETVRRAVRTIPGLRTLEADDLPPGTLGLDPLKLTVHVAGLGLSGADVEEWMRAEGGIEVELSDLYNVLFLFSLADGDDAVRRLKDALRRLSEAHRQNGARKPKPILLPEMPALALSPRDAFYAETERVPLEEAADRIMAEFILVYPPGIPVVMPGEILTQDNIDYIRANLAEGLPVLGPEDATLRTVRVIKERTPLR